MRAAKSALTGGSLLKSGLFIVVVCVQIAVGVHQSADWQHSAGALGLDPADVRTSFGLVWFGCVGSLNSAGLFRRLTLGTVHVGMIPF